MARFAMAAIIPLGLGAITAASNTNDTSASDLTVGTYRPGNESVNRASTGSGEITLSATATDNGSIGGMVAPTAPARVITNQETFARIAYRGSWSQVMHRGYLQGRAVSSNQPGASASLRFWGFGIAWIGPTGPTRGKAMIYVDGRHVRTVDTYSPHFAPSRVLYSATYKTERLRTFAIVVLGTKGRPTVALDALVVRSGGSVVAPASGDADSRPSPAPAPAPIPVPAPAATTVPAATTAPAVTTGAVTGDLYGPGINADNLNNSQVGGPQNQQVAYRFRATETSALNSIRIYIVDSTHSGYGGGTGGTLRITVQEDDGTPNHAPSSTILATTDVVHPVDGVGNLYSFASPAELVAGRLYHIVFRNVDSSPTVNFVSVDGLYVYADLPVWQPAFANSDWANLVKLGSGSWTAARGAGWGTITPIMALNYANGVVAGVGYMEVWYQSPKTISGSSQVREAFTVSGSSREVSSVSVRLKRVSGSSPLVVRLETSTGTLLEQGSISASSISTTARASWATYSFRTSRTLVAGQRYNLVLSSDSDTSYSIFVIRKGATYGFSPAYFADGSAQYNPGSGWVAFDPGWRGPLDEADLQFYFR